MSRSPIALVWTKEGKLGWELAVIDRSRGLRASGTAVGADPLPYVLVYELECDTDFIHPLSGGVRERRRMGTIDVADQ
ncbi:MAG: hypothetical protein M3214_08660 [Actinomycetota bacterium]|nr:hypothetical protein [Actinomycetota bacterium]